MAQRLTYRRRHSYRTKSNKVKIVKTPGGKLVYQHKDKTANVPKCGDCGLNLSGVRVCLHSLPGADALAAALSFSCREGKGGSQWHCNTCHC